MLKTIIGLTAATLTTASFVPQAIKTWRTRSTHDLSPLMFSLFCIGVIGWLIYGILIDDVVIIIANSITILLAGSIMYHIIRNQMQPISINHIAYWVDDIESCRSFYNTHFDVISNKLYRNTSKNFCSYFLSFSNGMRIELMSHIQSSEQDTKGGKFHIALSVGSESAVDQLTERLRLNGVKIISNPRTTGDGCYESVVSDPEGNLIELTI